MAALVAAANVLAFTLIAEDLFDGGGLIKHDHAVLAWFVDVRTTGLIDAARVISTLGGFVGLAVVSAVLAVVLHWRGWTLPLVGAPLVALLVAAAVSAVDKAAFGRPRPPEIVHATKVNLASFPSTHAADAAGCLVAASLVLVLTVVTRRSTRVLVVAVGLALAGLVGVSRLVLGVHWLSDVIAGWALGNAIAIVVVTTAWWATTRPKEAVLVSTGSSGPGAQHSSLGLPDAAGSAPSVLQHDVDHDRGEREAAGGLEIELDG